MVTFEMKVQYFIQKLDQKFGKQKQGFSDKLAQKAQDAQYVPRIIVDEDEYSDDEMGM